MRFSMGPHENARYQDFFQSIFIIKFILKIKPLITQFKWNDADFNLS